VTTFTPEKELLVPVLRGEGGWVGSRHGGEKENGNASCGNRTLTIMSQTTGCMIGQYLFSNDCKLFDSYLIH
jgi:hypothetical protein